jgi:hypothetical protein
MNFKVVPRAVYGHVTNSFTLPRQPLLILLHSDLMTGRSVSATYYLHGFHVREQNHERAICWYDQSKNLLFTHQIPRGRIPYTKQPPFEVTYRDMIGSSEVLHGFVFDSTSEPPQMRTPFYSFANEQQSVQFQSAARQRQLLQTFETFRIRTHSPHDFISYGMQLKVWQKPDEPTVTFTFFAFKGVDPVQHYEFDLLWFKQEVKRSGSRGLVLTFYTRNDERGDFVDGSKSKLLSMFQKGRSSSTGGRERRTSSHSRSSSASSNQGMLPEGDRIVTQYKEFLHWRSLHIEFMSEDGQCKLFTCPLTTLMSFVDVKQFLTVCSNPESAPGPQIAPERLWKIMDGTQETLHWLEPNTGASTVIPRPSRTSVVGPAEERAV